MHTRLTCLVWAFVALGAVATGQAAELAHRWSFNGDVKDSVGGQDAVIVDLGANNAILSDTDVTLMGGAKDSSDYIDLPDRILSSLGDDVTIEVWATQLSVQNWSRVWDFGSSTTHNVFMSWTNGTTLTADRVEWVGPNGTNTQDSTNAPYTLGTEFHIVCVMSGASVTWYSAPSSNPDLGAPKGSFQTSNRVSTLDDTNCWLGRSQWGDNTANARFNECRLWKGALTRAELEKLHDLGPNVINANVASRPSPKNGATDVPRDSILTWSPGQTAAKHDLYLGTSLSSVNSASRSKPLGVLISEGQDANSYDPPRFEFGQTYYWRVDEVNAAPDNTIFNGEIWRLTVEPYAYAIKDIKATASSVHNATTGPEKTVDGSGLDANDGHSTTTSDMWLSNKKGAQPTWIQYEFPAVCKLDEMLVWNSNQTAESTVGFGAKDVTIEYSTDGAAWTTLGDGDFEFADAPGEAGYVYNTTVNFGGVAAKFVKLTINSNWGDYFPQYGLSEVRFLQVPAAAREPSPAQDANNVNPQVALNWRAGREAASHEVYISTDQQAVTNGTVTALTVAQPPCDVALDLLKTYYWKVVEVNNAESPAKWDSAVWNFSTAEYVIVDDFESYTNDSPKRVFQTWIDGAGFSPDEFFPNGSLGNGSGALVGYDPTTGNVMETILVHGGAQSMPLYYDNSGGTRYSEAEYTFASPQDWTKHTITTLVIYFRGDVNNVAAPVYAKINGTKIVYNNGAACTALPVWKQWNILLSSVSGVNLKSVKSLAIGVGDGKTSGTGTIYVDDIRLYATAPQVVTPADPGTNGLVLLYAMEGNVQDTSGKGNNGTANGDPVYVQGMPGMGKAMQFDGLNDYVDMPIGTLLSTMTNATFAVQVRYTGTTAWPRILDCGTGTTVYMFMTPDNGASRSARFGITTSSNAAGAESIVSAPLPLGTSWHHLAAVIDATSMTLRLYLDGTLVASGPTQKVPKDMGVTTQNWLGRSEWTADPFLNATLDDFRIYNRALPESEVRYLAGDR